MMRSVSNALLVLKNGLEGFRKKEIDLYKAFYIVKNNSSIDGIDDTDEIFEAKKAFFKVASEYLAGGNPVRMSARSEGEKEALFERAMEMLFAYRDVLRDAHATEIARTISAIDETQVPDPF